MNFIVSLIAVILLMVIASVGSQAGLGYLLGVVIPYIAIVVFIVGVVAKVLNWSRSPVPFHIPTTCGQQKSLPWIKNSRIESPSGTLGVIGRMILEVLAFRSLFRNTKMDLKQGPHLVYGSSKFLWLGAMAFHWSFLIIFLRHFKFFAEPVPGWVLTLQELDGFFQVGLPIIYVTNILILASLLYLLLRRLMEPRIRYISLASDYFPLLLILGIAGTGVWMRYFGKVDIVSVKELATGIVTFNPPGSEVLASVDSLFYMHLLLVAVLFIYFPFSKLMHLGGVFLSPTRNLANNSRTKRHVNPWDYPVKVHTYEEWEDEFRPVMKAAGLPLEKEEE